MPLIPLPVSLVFLFCLKNTSGHSEEDVFDRLHVSVFVTQLLEIDAYNQDHVGFVQFAK